MATLELIAFNINRGIPLCNTWMQVKQMRERIVDYRKLDDSATADMMMQSLAIREDEIRLKAQSEQNERARELLIFFNNTVN